MPHLVRIAEASRTREWNVYGLLSTIEVERHRKSNPPVPGWLEADYRAAWQKLLELALADLRDGRDALTARSALGAVALAKGYLKLGAWLAFADESEIDEDLEEKAAWSDLYC